MTSINKSGVTIIIFNGKLMKPRKFRNVVKALSDKKILSEKGGYIFSLHIADDTIYIGILPYIIGDERSRHYDIDIPESKFNLVGFINADSSIEIFFKMDSTDSSMDISDSIKAQYIENYVRFARFMLEMDYLPSIELSFATKDVLQILHPFPKSPETIADLAGTCLR